ncbi:hypothetical protein BDV29DRAFT_186899 [Aspergillus leporis]|uniref:Uncharacterized protein n=1 Tax=Aspergillus leporis TaxID=41062 RepID=A0A5N5WFW1_9EURO|nr:hypothetical protein BDV29DRAFT_186899 [Aspergillus leporis]
MARSTSGSLVQGITACPLSVKNNRRDHLLAGRREAKMRWSNTDSLLYISVPYSL